MKPSRNLLASALFLLLCVRRNGALPEDAEDGQPPKKAGAEYLRRVMERLQSERTEGRPLELLETGEFADDSAEGSTPPPSAGGGTAPLAAEVLPSSVVSVPDLPPGLTATELAAIYDAAVTKLAGKLESAGPPRKPVSEFQHPPPPPPSRPPATTGPTVVEPAAQGPASFLPGYYYYYYPIKSFTKLVTEAARPTPKPVQMHATVHVTDASNKSVQPLFMAVSGFIGMALVFAFSVLFAPKFGKLRSGEAHAEDTRRNLMALGRVIFDSIEGKDCGERLACEIGRVVRGARMDDKPLRVLQIVLPPNLGKQIALVRKAAAKREKCSAIRCKPRKTETATAKPHKTKGKPWTRAEAAHRLWMQHFDKRTRFRQPENIWERSSVEGGEPKRQRPSVGGPGALGGSSAASVPSAA